MLYPHVPDGVAYYRQKEPVWFGNKRITVACWNGVGPIDRVTVNGAPVDVGGPDHVGAIAL